LLLPWRNPTRTAVTPPPAQPAPQGRDFPARQGRDFIARHGETVFNAARRLQGDRPHTPLTRAGFAQADEIGRALRASLGRKPALTLWASPTGRALQTLAVIAEHLELDWHMTHTDPRLVEIGMGSWGGRYYADVVGEVGPVITPEGLLRPALDGEDYPAIATRISGWLADTAADPGDRLVISHGISSRVLRGVMTGMAAHPEWHAPIAAGLPQGSLVLVEAGYESVAHLGSGHAPA
jgi:broad specificity phosphatase PhoE